MSDENWPDEKLAVTRNVCVLGIVLWLIGEATVYRILGSAEIFLQHGPYGFRSCQLIF